MKHEHCEAVRESIAHYLAGACNDAESQDIRRHLRSCKSCRLALAAETRLNRFMRQALQPRVEPGYWERTWPSIQVALVARQQRRSGRWLRWVLSGAGALAAVATVFLFAIIPSISSVKLATHDVSYFSGLESLPPAFVEEESEQDKVQQVSLELAVLSLGNAPPSQRVTHWNNLEGF